MLGCECRRSCLLTLAVSITMCMVIFCIETVAEEDEFEIVIITRYKKHVIRQDMSTKYIINSTLQLLLICLKH